MTATTGATGDKVEKHTELAPIHDFMAKLRQPAILPRLKAYVRWQAEARRRVAEGRQGRVRGAHQVGDGVDQGSIQVEEHRPGRRWRPDARGGDAPVHARTEAMASRMTRITAA